MELYDSYHLYVKPDLQDIGMIPRSGVRLDDLTISNVLVGLPLVQLHPKWPADFALEGMPRAKRLPLGFVAKMKVKARDRDVYGKRAKKEEEGWYYKWWRGIHPLMGKEGYDKGDYKSGPSHE